MRRDYLDLDPLKLQPLEKEIDPANWTLFADSKRPGDAVDQTTHDSRQAFQRGDKKKQSTAHHNHSWDISTAETRGVILTMSSSVPEYFKLPPYQPSASKKRGRESDNTGIVSKLPRLQGVSVHEQQQTDLMPPSTHIPTQTHMMLDPTNSQNVLAMPDILTNSQLSSNVKAYKHDRPGQGKSKPDKTIEGVQIGEHEVQADAYFANSDFPRFNKSYKHTYF